MSTADAKKVVQRLFDAFNADRFDEWDDLLAPDLTLNGREITADDYRAFARGLKDDDPEACITIDELIAEGDRIVARLSSRGRHASRWLGYEPTGRTYEIRGVYVFTVRDGRIHDAFDVWDWLGQMVQLGLWPPAGHTI